MKPPLITSSVLLLLTLTTVAKDINTSKFTRVICTIYKPDLLINGSCKVRPINRYKSVVTLSGFLTSPLNSLLAHVKLYKKFNTAYKPFLVNVHENFCEVFSKKYGAPYMRLLTSIFLKYSNLNHTCPFVGDVYIKDLPMDASKLKSIWPEGDYRLDIDIRVNDIVKPVWTIQLYLEMKEETLG